MSSHSDHKSTVDRLSYAGILISFGIVYGDIGTSPLYALKAIFGTKPINELLAIGALSAVFWTLTLQTTIKYIIITLRADNNGEGGIFSLYALVRRYYKWTLLPAILGGCFLLADGIITPPISVASAIEGLNGLYPNLDTIPIVIGILIFLFIIQQFGSSIVGNLFGPIMVIWFSFIGFIGLRELMGHWQVLQALNPIWAYRLLTEYPEGFWLLGGVFLCTTGAEALYSDIGHCGRANIRISWIYVKVCLLLSYAGQTSFALQHLGHPIPESLALFYAIIPQPLLIPSIILATLAAIIASQALISGSFTLVGEAMRLGLWPKLKVVYPSSFKGQLYVPMINWLLMFGCIGIVLHFRESSAMEAAYGLAVTLTMMMSTVLIGSFLVIRRAPLLLTFLVTAVFLTIEISFLIANSIKFAEGGYISIFVGGMLIFVMYSWYRGRQIKQKFIVYEPMAPYLHSLKELSEDQEIARYSTHLVYLTASNNSNLLESRIVYSIFKRGAKRADVFWFIHVNVVDEPYAMTYKVEHKEKDVIWITFNLGFRIEPRIGLFFRLVVEELHLKKEVNIDSPYASVGRKNVSADFRFVLMKYFLSYENELDNREKLIMRSYFLLDEMAISDAELFGLDSSNVTIEKIPLIINLPTNFSLIREI